MYNRNPDNNFTLKGRIKSVNTLSGFSSAWVSAIHGTGGFDFGQCAHIAYIIEFDDCL